MTVQATALTCGAKATSPHSPAHSQASNPRPNVRADGTNSDATVPRSGQRPPV